MGCGWRAIVCFSKMPRPDAILLTCRGHIRRALPTRSPGSVTPDTWMMSGPWSKIRIAAQRHVGPTCQRDDVGINQGGKFVGVAITVRTIFETVSCSRMQVDLCRTGGQMANESAEPRGRHRAG